MQRKFAAGEFRACLPPSQDVISPHASQRWKPSASCSDLVRHSLAIIIASASATHCFRGEGRPPAIMLLAVCVAWGIAAERRHGLPPASIFFFLFSAISAMFGAVNISLDSCAKSPASGLLSEDAYS
jgi:hypothetical protein